ncbi:hypothetical protein J2857_002856 [Neorhizobium galegae]|uniref:hypothetical protein n=1 Tax=Neorhizobium galegae TaxID=399 RepID=UPI001AE3246F|nr:hypothetical protein [Neorhizobium galegae]MBP2560087.1 hypothetical protein [Neorhizobium galegae]
MDDHPQAAIEHEAEVLPRPNPALVERVEYFFTESLNLSLVTERLGVGSASRSSLSAGVQVLRGDLGIDNGDYSRWRSGTQRKGDARVHFRVTKKLICLFAEDIQPRQSDGHGKRRELAFQADLINHWNRADPKLIAEILDLLNTHGQYLREQEERQAKGKLRGLPPADRADPGGFRPPEKQYVQRLTPETIPSGLRTIFKPEAFGRQKYVDVLVNLFMDPANRNALLTLDGPPSSGKSSVIRAGVDELAKRYRGRNDQPSLLFVDLASAESPQRALYLALALGRNSPAATTSRSDAVSFSGGSGLEDYVDREASQFGDAIAFLKSAIPPVDLHSGRLVVFHDYPNIEANETTARQIQVLIEQTSIRASLVVIESPAGQISPRAMARRSIVLQALARNEAVEFLKGPCNVPDDLAELAIAALDGPHGYQELFHPGPLYFGSGEFHRDILNAQGEAPDPQQLALSILEAATDVAERVVLSILGHDEEASESAMQSLMAMAVVKMLPISDEDLSRSGLSPIPRETLCLKRWFSKGKEPILVGFALHAMRAKAAQQMTRPRRSETKSQDVLLDAVKRILAVVRSDGRADIDRAIEDAVAWLVRTVPPDNPLLTHLSAILYQLAVYDDVPPLSEEREFLAAAEFRKRAVEHLDPDDAISGLIIAARAKADTVAVRKRVFLEALDSLMKVVLTGVTFNSRQLIGIDGALDLATSQYDVQQQVLTARQDILSALDNAGHGSGRVGQEDRMAQLLKDAMISFKLNTADLLISFGDVDAAEAIDAELGPLLDLSAKQETNSFTHWKMARVAILRSRLVREPAGQCLELEKACLHAQDCLRAAPQDMRAWRFLLRTTRRYVKLEASTKPRQQIVDSSIALLLELYGQPENWAGELRGRVASLLRSTMRLERSAEARTGIARRAMKILVPMERAANGDLGALELIEKARLHAILGETRAALAICRDLTENNPSVDAWMVRLLVEDGENGEVDEVSATAMFDIVESAPISISLLSTMRNAEKWVKDLPDEEKQSPRVARLWLWIKTRRWKEEGSIERVVRSEVEREGKQFDRMRLKDKLDMLEKEYNNREGALRKVERYCKRSVDLIYIRARNCGQLVRSQAVHSGKEPDIDRVVDVYNQGLKKIPDSEELVFHKAEYHRYTWRVAEAISGFREVLGKAERADLRQSAAISLAKTLHVTAIELEGLADSERLDRLTEADALVKSLSDTPEKVPEILLLKEHLTFELGGSVDWIGLDAVCDKVAEEVDAYLPSMLRNLETLKMSDDRTPRGVSDALADNFTSREVLGSVAQLYFRRGVKGDGNDAHTYFKRAASLHCAVAMLERSWFGSELAVTRFNIARTISLSADLLHDPNPIEHLWIGGAKNQLRFAGARLHMAAMNSAGEFRRMARRWQGIVSRQVLAMEA